MKKIEFKEGKLVQTGFVEIDGRIYNISEAEYTGETPLSPEILNMMQENIEEGIEEAKKELTITTHIIHVSSLIPEGNEFTLPCKYRVGNHSLRVHWENVLLEEGENGNYMEVGDKDSISDKIKIGWDIEPGETLIIEVRGVVE